MTLPVEGRFRRLPPAVLALVIASALAAQLPQRALACEPYEPPDTYDSSDISAAFLGTVVEEIFVAGIDLPTAVFVRVERLVRGPSPGAVVRIDQGDGCRAIYYRQGDRVVVALPPARFATDNYSTAVWVIDAAGRVVRNADVLAPMLDGRPVPSTAEELVALLGRPPDTATLEPPPVRTPPSILLVAGAGLVALAFLAAGALFRQRMPR